MDDFNRAVVRASKDVLKTAVGYGLWLLATVGPLILFLVLFAASR